MNRHWIGIGLVILAWNTATLGQQKPPLPAAPAIKTYTVWPFDAKEAARRQEETANALGLKAELALNLGENLTIKLVLIPPGKFVMGSPETEPARLPFEGPQHAVTITKAYYMGVTEVTQAQYQAIMGNNPSTFKVPDHPVDNVSWNDSAKFCAKLSEKTKKTARLPTEAEWEFACRAGTPTVYSFSGNVADYAWFVDNSEKKTHPVGLKKPNRLGLYDMHGNVWEWCSDWYDEKYYAKAKPVDPQGAEAALKRSVRGGAWAARQQRCTTAVRGGGDPARGTNYTGFRVVIGAE